ncbi:MAG: hypothetical protein M3011_00270 [Actinomycetota bacterium]|nr:hypothetical protein [Actinomycetota bacterium]
MDDYTLTVAGFRFPADEWARREANADRLAEAAVAFLDAEAGESAGWLVTRYPHSIVEGTEEPTECREWLRVTADNERINAFYDTVTGRRIVSSTSGHGGYTTFTPAS